MSIWSKYKQRREQKREEREEIAHANAEMRRSGDEEPESMTDTVQSANEEFPAAP